MHLTLKFIGNTTEESIDSINNAIHDVVKDTPFINLSISGNYFEYFKSTPTTE